MANEYIELHAHLDGAITPAIARKLAAIQGTDLPASDAELTRRLTVPADCKSLNDFLECFALPGALLQTPESLEASVRLVLENMANQHVAYAELRFAPQLHNKAGMTQTDAVRAALKGLENSPIPANLILCCMRGCGNETANAETIDVAAAHLTEDGGVVALDLAGAEALFPTENYRELFSRACELKIPFTLHAGEAAGPESVRTALDMGAHRIGHGVRAADDPELVEWLARLETPLEMCPTSNRQTHAIEDMAAYPLARFIETGVRVTLNTDDMAIEGTTLAEEFDYAVNDLGLRTEQIPQLNANAIDAAFTSDATKRALRTRFGL